MKLKKNKAFNFIKPFYKYSDEVLGIDASLDSIKHLISTGNYTFRGNEIYGTRNTNNGNKVLLYLKIDDNEIYSEIEGKYVKSAKKYKRIGEKAWVVGETIIKQKNYRTDIYTTAYLYRQPCHALPFSMIFPPFPQDSLWEYHRTEVICPA